MKNKGEIIIIGSGLSAYGALLAAGKQEVQITIIDVGDEIPKEISDKFDDLSKVKAKDKYKFYLRHFQVSGKTKLFSRTLPKKHIFGSYFFYKEERINKKYTLPFSEALGGYSVAWGGATLVPRCEDLPDLPFSFEEILLAIESIKDKFPVGNLEDSLTPYFPNLSNNSNSNLLKLSKSQTLLKDKLVRLVLEDEKELCLVGQARLLTYTTGDYGCQYCGMCSSGCSYNSIFSSKNAILEIVKNNKINYLPNRRVVKLEEISNKVRVTSLNILSGSSEELSADFVFVAAGAVNSTKIALRTYDLINQEVKFLKTGGFVRAYFSIQKLGLDWPNQNTQANVFMELKNKRLSKYWVHNQVSTPNEIVIDSIGLLKQSALSQLFLPIRKWFLSHLVLVMTNLHSSEGPYYEVRLSDEDKDQTFQGNLAISSKTRKVERKVDRGLIVKLSKVKIIFLPFSKRGVKIGSGFHLGGSIPMGGPGVLSTDSLGRFKGSDRISFVDTSVLPNIPGTTVGFFATANAFRIANLVLSKY